MGDNGRQRETMGDNGRQDHFRAQETDHTNQHQGGQISSCIKNPNSKLFGEKRGLFGKDISVWNICSVCSKFPCDDLPFKSLGDETFQTSPKKIVGVQ